MHPHHDLIIAYLEDKQIQYKSMYDWIDIPKLSSSAGIMPPFHHHGTYRIKPTIKPDVVIKQRVKRIGKEIVVRDSEHWERDNVEFEFDESTGELVSVKLI